MSRGIVIETARRSPFMDTNVPANEKLYGYHRLEDPLVQQVIDGQTLIVRQSEHEAVEADTPSGPEPLDGRQPFIIGRHDIEGVTYKEG